MTTTVCPAYSSELTIDLGALRANYRALAAQVAPAECGAVVKADAYGLGAAKVVPALYMEGCRTFFVAHLSEAISLGDAIGEGSTVIILNGLDPDCESLCADLGFLPVLNSTSQVERWRSVARERKTALPAVLQVDSGMSRLGLDLEAAARLAADPRLAKEISLRLIMTHLACADEPGHIANVAQLARFNIARSLFPGVPASCANSGGSFLGPQYHFDIARPGVALFGVAPSPAAGALQPVVHLKARVLQIREIPAEAGVGYGLDFIADRPRRIATVAAGYADGWPRHLSNVGAAWHCGRRLPIAGRVSMDSMSVDITALLIDDLDEGDFVELIGPSQSLDTVASEAGTIAYEILTSLGRRHHRIYVDGDQTDILTSGVDQ